MERLEKELGNDFGPDEQFFSLQGACVSTQVQQYTYEVCPYATSYQKEGGSSTSLGDWQGYEVENGVTQFKFTGGQTCSGRVLPGP